LSAAEFSSGLWRPARLQARRTHPFLRTPNAAVFVGLVRMLALVMCVAALLSTDDARNTSPPRRRKRPRPQNRGRSMDTEVTYNLFRQGRDPAIVCAVPNDKPVPRFIRGPAWIFESTMALGVDSEAGFDPTLAQAAANANGFYLFVSSRLPEISREATAIELRAAA
jgi:hypothetical protein